MFTVWGSNFRIWGLGFRVRVANFGIEGLGCRAWEFVLIVPLMMHGVLQKKFSTRVGIRIALLIYIAGISVGTHAIRM